MQDVPVFLKGITVVDDFSLDRYLGTWHEIVRLDNRFEKELDPVSATYSLAPDGSVKVVNKGYDLKKQEWKTIQGRGVFLDDKKTTQGALKVSFFGPFYASYNVIDLDKAGYRWAMVCGRDKSYFWILSKDSVMEQGQLDALVARAAASVSIRQSFVIWAENRKSEQVLIRLTAIPVKVRRED